MVLKNKIVLFNSEQMSVFTESKKANFFHNLAALLNNMKCEFFVIYPTNFLLRINFIF